MRVLSTILGLIIFAVLAIRSTKAHRKKQSIGPIVWKDTVGTLDPQGYRKGTIYYVVNGVTHHADFVGITDKELKDQKFTMRYNIGNPEEVQVDDWNPVFVEGEKKHLLIAKVKKIQHVVKYWSPAANITYTYIIPFPDKPRKIERWIYLPKDFEQRYPNLKEGQYYEVEVGDKDIYRSVLHLDRPLRDSVSQQK